MRSLCIVFVSCMLLIVTIGMAPVHAATPAMTGGEYHTVALDSDGAVWTWGHNGYGQLGDGTTTARTTPAQISGLGSVTAIATGGSHAIALKPDGTVWTWGYNALGQLGDGTTTNSSTPTQVPGLSNVTAVSGNGYITMALKTDGTVWAWGMNGDGQLGDGTRTQRTSPVQVSGLTNVAFIAAGIYHALAVKDDGTVWAWGQNSYGQLGDGTTTARLTPVQISGLGTVTSIVVGIRQTLALKDDGTVWAWGRNSYGCLGDGTTTDRHTPVQVSGLSDVTAIDVGYYHSPALKSDGTVWTWGYNGGGRLGDGTTTDRHTPVQVSGLSDVAAIGAGASHTMALKSGGTMWAWGGNRFGAIGDGTTYDRNTPVQVLGAGGVGVLNLGSTNSPTPPTVTTEAVSSIAVTMATGNGTITDLGSVDPTAHGVCWNIGGTPTTSDTCTNRGNAGATGSFASNMIDLSANTLYYVRAYATNTDGTAYGDEVSFTTTGPPVLTSPSGTITDNTPTYSWNAVSGSANYRLWVMNSAGRSVMDATYAAATSCSGGSCSVTPAVTLSNDDYNWWAQDVTGGRWSSSTAFTVNSASAVPVAATPGSPSDTVTDNTPTYTWTEVSGASSYELWVLNTTTGTLVHDAWYTAATSCSGGACSVTPTDVLPNASYSWALRTQSTNGNGPWSLSQAFAVNAASAVPAQAVPTSPSGAITDTTPAYTWTEVSNTDDYLLWVIGPSGKVVKSWYSGATSCSDGSCSIDPDITLALGDYLWFLKTRNAVGEGPWCTLPGSFTVADAAPDMLADAVPVTFQAVSVQKRGSGSGTLIIGGQTCDAECPALLVPFTSGESVTVSVIPADGSLFVGWENEDGTPLEGLHYAQPATQIYAVFEMP